MNLEKNRNFHKTAVVNIDSDKNIVFSFGAIYPTKKALKLLSKNGYEIFSSPEVMEVLKIPVKEAAEDYNDYV